MAIKRLNGGTSPKPYKCSEPVKLAIEFRLVEMADSACHTPGSFRENGTILSFSCSDMSIAYRTFRAAVGLA